MIAAIKIRGDVPCLGAALGLLAVDLVAGALFAGVGMVVMFAREGLLTPPTGTGGTTILLVVVAFFADFFATFLTDAFLAVAFFAVVFFTTFLTAAFFFAGAFLATFLTAAFFTAFFAGAFLATFLTEAFFLTATLKLPLAISDLV
jgi:hypothetical protein